MYLHVSQVFKAVKHVTASFFPSSFSSFRKKKPCVSCMEVVWWCVGVLCLCLTRQGEAEEE